VDVKDTDKVKLSRMMVGRDVDFIVTKGDATPGKTVLEVEHLTVPSKAHTNNAVKDVSFNVRAGEIVCLAGIEGNGQTEFVYALTGLEKPSAGRVTLKGEPILRMGGKRGVQATSELRKAKPVYLSIRKRNILGMSHIPEDRQKLASFWIIRSKKNLVLERYWQPGSRIEASFARSSSRIRRAAYPAIRYPQRSGSVTPARSMSGGHQQKRCRSRRSIKIRICLSQVQRRAASTSAQSSTSTSSSSPRAIKEKASSSSRLSWTR
jgi:simple sugar transport system ATP-binding protein